MPRSYAVLVRHFFGRFFDKESLSPQGEPETNIVQSLGILAVPGAFAILALQALTLRGWGLITFRCYFVSFSMIVMAFIVLWEWDKLFPDLRDYQILTPLPLGRFALFATKMAALGLFLGLFLVDINFFGTLFWPGVDGGNDLLPILGAHVVAVGAGGLFAALAAASVQGALITVLGGKAFRRVSVAMQTVLMSALVMLLFLTPLIAPALQPLSRQNSPLLQYFPVFWFVGLYERLRPATGNAALLGAGRLAMEALAAVALVFVLAYLPGYRRNSRKILEAPAPSPAGPGRLRRAVDCAIDKLLLKSPAERAVFHFISETIGRSAKHRLFLAVYSGFGAALAVMSFASGSSGLLRLPLTLSFVLVSGLRAAFNFPAELRANWTFQVNEGNHVAGCLSAMRKWIVACAILPLFLLMAPVEFAGFPWPAALFHLAFGITLAVLLMDIMFFGFRKVPFACAYFPGKFNLIGLGALYIYGFTTYSDTMSQVEAWLSDLPLAGVAFFGAAFLAHHLLVHWRQRHLDEVTALDYEDAGDPVVRTLDLTS